MCTDSSRVAGNEAPQLVGRERQDRRHQPRQTVGHHVHRRLRRSPLRRPRGERVQPILGDVGVERAQIDRRERVQPLEDGGVVVLGVRLDDALAELAVAPEDVAVDFLEAIERHSIDGRIEVVQIRQQIPERVPDLAIRLDRARAGFPC